MKTLKLDPITKQLYESLESLVNHIRIETMSEPNLNIREYASLSLLCVMADDALKAAKENSDAR